MVPEKMKTEDLFTLRISGQKALRSSVRYWWLFLISGMLLMMLGLLVINQPQKSYAELTIYIIAIFLLNGLMEILFSISNHASVYGWGWYLASGLFDLLCGITLLISPVLAAVSLPLFVGGWLLLRSSYALVRSWKVRSFGMPDWQWLFSFALAGLIFSFLIFYKPAWGRTNLVTWTTLALFADGLFFISLGLRLRTADKWIKYPSKKNPD